jgi:hypothetical protein
MRNYDLVAVWEEHLRSEFVARDVDGPTDTMVPDACVRPAGASHGACPLSIVSLTSRFRFRYIALGRTTLRRRRPIRRSRGGRPPYRNPRLGLSV